ncbi:hypothetical protein [Prosthecobacter dejongeii]|uniref:Uncharacterized protein n=1 Tax=Prosthecobacter dejongeii TaxID=48465 RepID=A0A7W7YHL4_9BACT|nr:hypothetical protein [Prosthecobacter dejongeii]MBB5036162.1 hypothetical protein [Prosthecobacter dejongeii]
MTQEHEYPKSAAEAFTDALKALELLGKVRYRNPEKGLIRAQVRHRLAKVNVSVQIAPQDDASLMTFQVTGSHAWTDVADAIAAKFASVLKTVSELGYEKAQMIDRQERTIVGWMVIILGLLVIFFLPWNFNPKHVTVTTDGAALYTSMEVLEEAYDAVMRSPEMWTLNRELGNNPVRDQLLPAYQPMMKRVTDRVLQRFENSGDIIRVKARTSCEILGKTKDPMTDEVLFKVRLTDGRHSSTIGYIHQSAVR